MPFGQLVLGPAGSGKSTYCNGVQHYLTLAGRKVAVINLDPGCDALPYPVRQALLAAQRRRRAVARTQRVLRPLTPRTRSPLRPSALLTCALS